MKETVADAIRSVMAKVSVWTTAAELKTVVPGPVSVSTIRRALAKEGYSVNAPGASLINGASPLLTYKWMYVPNDRLRRKQWALASIDTTNFANVTPITSTPRVKKQRTKKLASVSAVAATSPSYQGVPMCLPATTATKLSLIKAVGDLVMAEFFSAQKKFTAYDVTQRLREAVFAQQVQANKDNLPFTHLVEPTEVGFVHVQGTRVAKIEHEDVKAIVHELFNTGSLVGYDRFFNGAHFEYDLATSIATAAAAIAAAAQPLTIIHGVAVVTTPDPVTPDPAGVSGTTYDGSSTI